MQSSLEIMMKNLVWILKMKIMEEKRENEMTCKTLARNTS